MKLTTRQQNTLKKHSEHHSAKHMAFMKRLMRQGVSFSQAHKRAQAKVGK
jgi:hypothetical protein